MLATLSSIKPDSKNIFLLWEGEVPSVEVMRQIRVCLKSIHLHEPTANVWLFSNVLHERDLCNRNPRLALVRWNQEALGHFTGLTSRLPVAQERWCLWSDVFRVTTLFCWGGTYFDVDDIMIRPIPRISNVVAACFLTPVQSARWLPYPVIPGRHAAERGMLSDSRVFRFGADPLTNFKVNNEFLRRWMLELPVTEASLRGQVLPSRIFASDPEWARAHTNPVNWTDLLYQPYEGGHHPEDKRYAGNVITADMLTTKREYEERRALLVNAYSFYLVKNHLFRMHLNSASTQPFLSWFVRDLFERLEGLTS